MMIQASREQVLASGVGEEAAVGFQLINPVSVERGLPGSRQTGELAGGQCQVERSCALRTRQRKYCAVGIVDTRNRGGVESERVDNGSLSGGGKKLIGVRQQRNGLFRILAQAFEGQEHEGLVLLDWGAD